MRAELAVFIFMTSISQSILADTESDQLETRRDQLANQRIALSAQLSSSNHTVNTLNTQQADLNSSLKSTRTEQSVAEQTLASKNAELGRTQSSLDQVQAKQQSLQSQNDQLRADIAQAERELSDVNNGLGTKKAAEEASKAQLDALDRQKRGTADDIAAKQKEIDALKRNPTTPPTATDNFSKKSMALMDTVGTLLGPQRNCSAIRVEKDQILTALHCVDGLQQRIGEFLFMDSKSQMVNVTEIVQADRDHDAVTLKLSGAVDNYQPILSLPKLDRPVRLIGFDDAVERPVLSNECKIVSFDLMSASIIHDCPSKPGMSGGALVQDNMIIGFHIGVMADGNKLAAFAVGNRYRAIPVLAESSVTFEYHCNSDCDHEANSLGLPYPCGSLIHPRICHRDVFDPVVYAACNTAKATDCSSREAAQQLEVLKNNLRGQVDQLASQVNSLNGQLAPVLRRITDLNGAIDQTKRLLEDARSRLRELNSTINSLQDRITANNNLVGSVQQNISALSNEGDFLTGKKTDSIAQLSDIKAKIGLSDTNISSLNTSIAAVSRDLSAQGNALGELTTEKLQLANLSATSSITSGLAADIRSLSETPTVVFNPNDFLHKLGDTAKTISPPVNGNAADIYKKILGGVERAIQDGGDYLRDHLRVPVGKCDYRCQALQQVHANEKCLKRASIALDHYKAGMQQLKLKEISDDVEKADMLQIIEADQGMSELTQELSALHIELKMNKCDTFGTDQLVLESLMDASEWGEWLRRLKYEKMAANGGEG